jgi:hypothetical protein
MRKIYVVIAALVVAIAVALGTYVATLSTTALGPSSSPTGNVSTVIAQTNQRLSSANAAINAALSQRPPSVNGGHVPFVAPHQVVVNVTGSASAVAYTPPVASFGDEGGGGGD